MYVSTDSERIKGAVTVTDVISRYHQTGRYKGRTNCPFCPGERKDSLGFDTKAWHCFRCGASGDAIGFVERLFGLDFKAALKKLGEDFGIPLGEHLTPAERKAIAQAAAERKRQQEIEIAVKYRNDFNFRLACRYLWWLRKQPKSKIVLIQLAEMEEWTDRMAIGNMIIDYDIKAALRCMRLKITEERNDIIAGSNGGKTGTDS